MKPVDRIVQILKKQHHFSENANEQKLKIVSDFSDRLTALAKIRANNRNSVDVTDSDFKEASHLLIYKSYGWPDIFKDLIQIVGSALFGASIKLTVDKNYNAAFYLATIGLIIIIGTLISKNKR